MWWVIMIAIFWIPPVFLAWWLSDVKEPATSSYHSSAGWSWGVLGWIGTAIYALKHNPSPASASRSRIVLFVSLLGICGSVGAMIYAYQHQPIDVAASASEITGRPVDRCEIVGWINLDGTRDDVYGCVSSAGLWVGCFTKDAKFVYDVTDNVRALRELGGADLGCVPS